MTSSVYLREYGYAARKNARLPQDMDVNAVGHEIAALTDEHGKASYEKVVEAARSPRSAMHTYYDWNDTTAAASWRIDQARYLVRSIVRVVANTQTEEEYPLPTRVFVADYIPDQPATAGVFHIVPLVSAEPIPTSPELTDVEREGLAALHAWIEEFGDMPLFAPVVAALRKLPKG